jgi:hypothetical protein
MKNFNVITNTLLSVLKRGYQKWKGRRSGRNIKRPSTTRSTTLRYGLSTRPQKLGKGSTNINVTYDDVVGSTFKNYNIAEIIGGNSELIQSAIRYRWFRVTRFAVIAYAHNLNSEVNAYPTYIRMLWTDDTTTNIEKDDSTKIVSSYETKNKVFKFIPPNASLPITSVNTSLKQMNYREWVICDDVYDSVDGNYKLPGTIQVAPTVDNYRIRIEALVEFRGRKEINSDSLTRIVQVVKKEEEEEEKKMKEREEKIMMNKFKRMKEEEKLKEEMNEEEERDTKGERVIPKVTGGVNTSIA